MRTNIIPADDLSRPGAAHGSLVTRVVSALARAGLAVAVFLLVLAVGRWSPIHAEPPFDLRALPLAGIAVLLAVAAGVTGQERRPRPLRPFVAAWMASVVALGLCIVLRPPAGATLRVDARILAATNRNLLQGVAEGHFRQDLYYRLHVFPIEAPPLRARREDIPELASFFVSRFARKLGKPVPAVPKEAMTKLMDYSWPGNVRELENVVERAVILTTGNVLSFDTAWFVPEAEAPAPSRAGGFVGVVEEGSLADVEKRHILQVLEKTQWRIAGRGGAAERLGLKPSTLRSRMEKLGVRRGSAE